MSEPSLAHARLVVTDIRTAGLDADAPVSGEPATSTRPLGSIGGVDVGAWQIEPGVATDTEVDEMFVVLSGHGVVEFEDGSTIDLAPGVVVHLRAGDRTRWSITEPLRKVYVAR